LHLLFYDSKKKILKKKENFQIKKSSCFAVLHQSQQGNFENETFLLLKNEDLIRHISKNLFLIFQV
jgi:hypothetical protein